MIKQEDLMPLFEEAVSVMNQLIKTEINKQLKENLPTKEPIKLFYSIKDIVEITALSYSGILNRIKRGTIKGCKSQNTYLVSQKNLEIFINQLEYKKRVS